MTNIVVRGLAEAGSLVTAGLGPTDGVTQQRDTSGIVVMLGTLGVTFIAGTGGTAADKTTGSMVSIDIDIGID